MVFLWLKIGKKYNNLQSQTTLKNFNTNFVLETEIHVIFSSILLKVYVFFDV